MLCREEVLSYILKKYGVSPDYPWKRTPRYAILRHEQSRKWFCAVLDIAEDKLGLPGKKTVDALNLKCDPLMMGSMLTEPDIFPGYHMNKDHWISVLLSGTLPKETIFGLVDLSFELTKT